MAGPMGAAPPQNEKPPRFGGHPLLESITYRQKPPRRGGFLLRNTIGRLVRSPKSAHRQCPGIRPIVRRLWPRAGELPPISASLDTLLPLHPPLLCWP